MTVVVVKSAVLFEVKSCRYNRITSTESQSLCMTTFSTSLTNPKDLLPQSHDCSYNVKRRMLASPPLRLHKRTHDPSTLLTYDIRLGSLKLHAPEAGYFTELIILYQLFRGTLFLPLVFRSLRQ